MWGQISGLLELMLCALSLLQHPSRVLASAFRGHNPQGLPSGSCEARKIIRGPLGTSSHYSFLQQNSKTMKAPYCISLPRELPAED